MKINRISTVLLLIAATLANTVAWSNDEGAAAAMASAPALSKERIKELLVPEQDRQHETYFKRHAEGWWWYKDPEIEEDPDLEKGEPKDVLVLLDSSQTVEQAREVFQASLNTALMKPSRFNVKRYMYAKQWFMERAEVFANVVQRVRWQSPDLDYSLVRPVNSMALQVYKQERNDENTENMTVLAQQGAGLFFFMSSTCQYCAAMSPIIRMIEEEYGIQVMAITMDGGGLPEYPNPKRDNGISNTLGVYTVPSLYLVMPETEGVIPIGTGLMSKTEIVERVFILNRRAMGESR